MKPSLQLRVGQSLTMTPQLQQAIKLLQLSSLELQTEVQDALESNMMLELDVEEDIDIGNQNERDPVDETPNNSEPIETNIQNESLNIPEDLPVDSAWEDIYDGSMYHVKNYTNNAGLYENQDTNEKTLRDHLLWQLNVIPTTETDKIIAITIIDSLDDDGYLTCKLEDIHESLVDDLDVGLDEIEAVLRLVQAMEPVGIASRDLKECLQLQLNQGCERRLELLE